MDFSFSSLFNFTMTDWIIGGALLLFFLIQLLFYMVLYRKPYCYARRQDEMDIPDESLPPISVVIASKNESEDLALNLPAILEQDYPNFEVIVINSGSTDETDVLLKALEQKYPNLYHTYVPQEAEKTNEKKLALTIGIKAAKNDILLFTEPYCKPVSDKWIREFARKFTGDNEIVLGYSGLQMEKRVFMRRFIRYDNLIHSLKYLSMALVGKPFMGIGRNMAYKKELFFSTKGFSSILGIDGGEDDLFINRIARHHKTGVVLSPESIVEANVVDSFSTWRSLKSRYLYAKQFYKGGRSFVFGWETFSKYMFYFSVLAAIGGFFIFHSTLLLPVLAVLLFILRFIFQLVIINNNGKQLDSVKYHINLLIFDFFQPINNFRFRQYAKKRNNYKR